MTLVAVLALDGVVPFELSAPGQVLGTANDALGRPHYEVRICAPRREVRTAAGLGEFRLGTDGGLEVLAEADTVVIPGHAGSLDVPPAEVVEALRAASARGARLASVCVGAFTLAATGLLDGHRATTHWMFAAELARRHPAVEVDDNSLYIDNGSLITSAGVAAALDLCLHLVHRDLGAAIAAATARRIVMTLQRDGGQSQFIDHSHPVERRSTLQPTLEWMESRLHEPLSLDDVARHAAMSIRSLNRHFRAQTGTTPLQWLLRARVNRAQQLLESGALPVQRIAIETGFGAVSTFRQHFTRHTGVSPQAYRAAFRSPDSR
ncbi:GlxA family transcriptional regulator [Streptomyces albipurpureus]|uniref:Helix-turn-helix domain-containing protein n=1 Tax=Streptomyces albipurpureus TaxID=2897419 RepID=A0ABT0UIY0_9ACTN|nr:helix-turn-helix domain-containing protein [Streptomyces sp. CWNU-1]MCM2387954.1 helix-turn-helix domain-containing protein [Streptomyces sp. CWNU-1]